MSKRLTKLLTVAIFAIFVVYFIANKEQFRPLLHVNGYLLFLIALGDFSTIAANGLFIKYVLRPFNKHISVQEGVYVSLISSVGNFFAPAGSGFGFRAVYLKRRHGLPYSEYLSTLAGNYVIVFLVNSFFGLVALYMLRAHRTDEYFVLVAIFGALFAISLILSLVRIPPIKAHETLKNRHLSRIAKILFHVTEGWNRIIKNRQLMRHLIGVIAFNFLLTFVVAWLIIASLHFHITFPALLLFSVLGGLSLFVNITPANLGVKEAIYIFSSHVIGFSVSQVLSIALIDRGVLFITLSVLWAYSSTIRKKLNMDSPQTAA